jgi:hypothetical protein
MCYCCCLFIQPFIKLNFNKEQVFFRNVTPLTRPYVASGSASL